MFVYALALLLVSNAFAGDVVDVLIAEKSASTLVQLVSKAGLVDALKAGTFTIFAPTDDAFAKLDQAVLSSLLQDSTKLADILQYHVVSGNIKSTDIRNEEKLKALNGDQLRLNVYTHNHLVTINGINITETDRQADNGVIHFVDEVIMPPAGTIVDLVSNDPDLSTLLTAVQKAGIANEFLADPLTVFAPTNAAFAAVDKDDLNKLLGSPERLKETLEYHAVPHTLYSKGVWNHEYPKSTDSHDDRLHIRVNSNGVTINNAKVISADYSATNGVVHKIDHVLLPLRVVFWLRSGNLG